MLKAASAAVFTCKQPVDGRRHPDLAFLGVVLPGDTLPGQGACEQGGRLVLVDLVIRKIDHIQMVLPQLLEMADIFVAHRVALAEGRALELPGPDLRDVVRQLGPHRILQVDFFQHIGLRLSRFRGVRVSAAAAFLNVAQFTLKAQTDSGSGHTPACKDFIFVTSLSMGTGSIFQPPSVRQRKAMTSARRLPGFSMMPVIMRGGQLRHLAGRPVHVRPGDLAGFEK